MSTAAGAVTVAVRGEDCGPDSSAAKGINEYNGCGQLTQLDIISASDISPEDFFQKYIATRTPVVLKGPLPDKEWQVSGSRWTNSYLRANTPPDLEVKVEHRDYVQETFGQGKEMWLKFHSFLDEIDSGSQNWYLSTQELEYDYEDQPEILSAPLTSLRKDFPLTPSLFKTLIPSNINLWYGQTAASSTSGLHHDYHDNLYIMLKGQKRITLFSPALVESMYVEGKWVHVHPNGRINYEGQVTHADGRALNAEKAWKASKLLKEAAAKNVNEGSDEDEDELDKAMQAVLDAETDDCDEDKYDDADADDTEDADKDEGEIVMAALHYHCINSKRIRLMT